MDNAGNTGLQLLKPDAVAVRLACTRKHVYALVALGALEAVKIGPRGLRITEASLARFVERNRVTHGAA